MITSLIVQKNNILSAINVKVFSITSLFSFINRRGLLTAFFLGVIGTSVAVYLAALYTLFGSGIIIKQKTSELKKLMQAVIIIESAVQEKQTTLLVQNKDVFDAMEKISTIRYVLPENVAVSHMVHPLR